MKRTHKQKVKRLESIVLGDALKTPSEYNIDNEPICIHQNGKNLIIIS